jgi:uncharacterized protein YecT (DUF1311 family)
MRVTQKRVLYYASIGNKMQTPSIASILFYTLLSAPAGVTAQSRPDYDRSIDCSRPDQLNQMERNQCGGRSQELAEYSMSATYRQLLSRAASKEDAQVVAEAQKSWQMFRVKECEANARMQGFRPIGSMYGEVVASCQVALAERREKELAQTMRTMNELQRLR